MAYLDIYTTPLTEQTAAHLLRRATLGPRPQEITSFTGLTASVAVDQLINNCVYNLPEPVEYDQTRADKGQPFLHYWVDLSRNFILWKYVKYWWIGYMADQSAPPSILEKLTLFWQNHFVTNAETVGDYRYQYQNLKLCRDNALGNFRTFVTNMTKDSAMLRYLNGNTNVVGAPNENYARELQELFMVGQKSFIGNPNYTESDIKEAARALTGWYDNFGAYTYNSDFNSSLHDTGNKVFSSYYNNSTITGQSGYPAGQNELDALITILLNHPETPKFICRKLYRWFVHTNVTTDIENNVIIPLANIFKNNNFDIKIVIKTLLKSQHFYDVSNVGAMIKSPCDLMMGAMRFYNFSVPAVSTSDVASFANYANFLYQKTNDMQMPILQQPTVFGYEPYYQIGLSRVWINSTSLAQRGAFTDSLVDGTVVINSSYTIKIDVLAMANIAMNNVAGDPILVVQYFTKNLFATGLDSNQITFLTDTIMMGGLPRGDWAFEYPANTAAKVTAATARLKNLLKYLLRMAEFQLF